MQHAQVRDRHDLAGATPDLARDLQVALVALHRQLVPAEHRVDYRDVPDRRSLTPLVSELDAQREARLVVRASLLVAAQAPDARAEVVLRSGREPLVARLPPEANVTSSARIADIFDTGKAALMNM